MAGLAEVLPFISKNPKLTDMEIIKKGKKKIFLFYFSMAGLAEVL